MPVELISTVVLYASNNIIYKLHLLTVFSHKNIRKSPINIRRGYSMLARLRIIITKHVITEKAMQEWNPRTHKAPHTGPRLRSLDCTIITNSEKVNNQIVWEASQKIGDIFKTPKRLKPIKPATIDEKKKYKMVNFHTWKYHHR